ncbi:MAG: tryptophan--tRNA ligase [Gammaproteobacteria bacterium]|nr:tryptophan--tRNA ligase [Gammaproteobacteria bacterium]
MNDLERKRALSGMRPTGSLHLGHYHGALKNWLKLQNEVDCFYFVADWHALTTHYDEIQIIQKHVIDMATDWLAVGLDPHKATLFVQSKIPQHAELFTLLSMHTPLAWLERVPTYKDQLQKLQTKNLLTYGFLGYPLLQAADILVYKAHFVPVGEDQQSHVEMTREIARRFNFLYGDRQKLLTRVEGISKSLPSDLWNDIQKVRQDYQLLGITHAFTKVSELIETHHLSLEDQSALLAYMHGTGYPVLIEPQVLLTEASKLPGLDGQKMSKSYGNAIALRSKKEEIKSKINKMPTDPARIRKTDAGEPNRCPVWEFHKVYSTPSTLEWVANGCRQAKIGCLECKSPLIDSIAEEQEVFIERAEPFLQKPALVQDILDDGSQKARQSAETTLREVRQTLGL